MSAVETAAAYRKAADAILAAHPDWSTTPDWLRREADRLDGRIYPQPARVNDAHVTVASREPRVLHKGAECPEVGSRWREPTCTSPFTIQDHQKCLYDGAVFCGLWSWDVTEFPVTEILGDDR